MTYCGISIGDPARMTGDMTSFTINGNQIKSRTSGDAHLMVLQANATYKIKDFIVNGNRINARGGNNASGIYADYLTNSTIQGNRITAKGNRSPIQSTNDDSLTISGNSLVAAGSIAPLVMAGANATVYKNTGVPETSTKTAAYTLTATDSVILADATSAAFTLTLPSASGISGRQYTIKKVDSSANAATIASTSGNIDGAATKALSAQWLGGAGGKRWSELVRPLD